MSHAPEHLFNIVNKRATGCPVYNLEKKKQLMSLAQADSFNILSKRATGCPDDYYAIKKQQVNHAPADLFNIFSKQATGCPCNYYVKKKKSTWRAMLQQSYSIFSATWQEVVPETIMKKQSGNSLY